MRRANELTNVELVWKLKEHRGKLEKKGWSRELEVVYYHEDTNETFSVNATYPYAWKKGDPWGASVRHHYYRFHIAIPTVANEHISQWVKWVSTGEPLPAFWKDVVGGELKIRLQTAGLSLQHLDVRNYYRHHLVIPLPFAEMITRYNSKISLAAVTRS